MSDLAGLKVVVAGLGPMGRDISRVFDRAGADVRVVDVSPEVTEAGLGKIRAEAESAGEAVSSISAATLAEAVPDADVFLEAVVEDMDVKRVLLAEVAALGRDELLVASNTSSLSVGEMGKAFGDPGRVVGMHFFNPATKMRLVEVIVGGGTSEAVAERARELAEALGKTAVVCRDSPNFVVNRVCRPLYYEAQLLVTQGVPAGVVDAAASGGLGHPMGPLTLLDFTGLHTHLGSSETALREFGDPRYRPIPLARSLVRSGFTGRAAGRGFYDYGTEKPRAAIARLRREPGSEGADVRVIAAGPDARAFDLPATTGGRTITLYRCHGGPGEGDVAAVRKLAGSGEVVVDSSDGRWLDVLPAGVGWLRLHRAPAGDLFAEIVRDDVAKVAPTPAATAVVDAVGATSVEVPALPGLVVDRLAYCMVNEAAGLVEEGTASAGDVDVALTLGMNHPRGPFETLQLAGAPAVYEALRSMADLTGDPRYRPAQLLRRQAAGARP
ncbi:3-hydroxyacyl-CoA dehydrogenase NAD-binding domain-containing protein [Amycolatopsis carbonis]|uniref:3-hydroxyacyl-CoA dehydrogenase NAD-binding domain-containing protein n=1 Tax=Amycolatopsis carbonis TaxID=715471 RepID=A0A9Y2IDJ7_9PSEU|nr:3-hydroxyacyl-CoA dehydrogenase NAD-binding domain-containing protein [Amycolatopsis sp. 2-15]WIX77311.1 3-hydroxyacyl-CoA dehydrogenase NAD-binding domain-containing protein [Amycolatopsis sp. 2-15]